MSAKWTRNQSDSGILRKGEPKEKKEELFVFGYSCKLFRDDEKALHIDQGKHLIPWMGDDSLKIDRYDARGALHNLSALEAPPGGFDWRMELTRNELDVEQLCDEERYRAMHTDEVEEEMYKEEELKRLHGLHAAGYGQVGFNYEAAAEPSPTTTAAAAAEDEPPFIAPPALVALLPADVVLPDSEKLNAIIEKTAKFIASQGVQMEILLRAKQADNPQFKFLNKESELHPYYMALIALVKAGKWPEKIPAPEIVEERPSETDEYLHPSLSTISIESAPSIPSIPYRPSADCDYTLLVSAWSGASSPPAAGEDPPPGTAPLDPPSLPRESVRPPDIARPPLIYNRQVTTEAPAAAAAAAAAAVQHLAPAPGPPRALGTTSSTGLSLMKNYDSYSDASDSDSSSSMESAKPDPLPTPPEDVRIVIDKMAAYVARNGDEFADIVRAKNDPRFTFLDPGNVYHAWYLKLMMEKRGVLNGDTKKERKPLAPVSFSIKKLKEPEPVLSKPALPYESSTDDESDKPETNQESGGNTPTITPSPLNTPLAPPTNIPPVTVYRIDAPAKPIIIEKRPEISLAPKKEIKQSDNRINEVKSDVKPIEVKPKLDVAIPKPVPEKIKEKEDNNVIPKVREVAPLEIVRKEKSKTPEIKVDEPRDREDKLDKYKERRDYSSRSQSRDSRSIDSERRRHKHERVKRRKYSREHIDGEVITLKDNDELIDLTEDYPDFKDVETEADREKQVSRRLRAAEFLKKVGVDPAAALPASSLASAMVDTLESIRRKKAEEEAKRRKKEKRKRRYDHNGDRDSDRHKKKRRRRYDDETDESDYDSSKRKKRRKDKKTIKNKKKRRQETEKETEEEINDPPLTIDLASTLKELRYSSPSRELCFQDVQEPKVSEESSNSDTEEVTIRTRKEKIQREYSEGEWSSDSEPDSELTVDKESK